MIETIRKLVKLPRSFHSSNTSIYDLMKDTGYFEAHERITKEGIYDVLTRMPDYIIDWLKYSEDKRSSGWYLIRENADAYVIGCVESDGKIGKQSKYVDDAEACAVFIKNEAEDIMLGSCYPSVVHVPPENVIRGKDEGGKPDGGKPNEGKPDERGE